MSRTRRLATRGLFALAFVAAIACAFAVWIVKRQGLARDFWVTFPDAKVHFDADGIPTIEAGDWNAVVRAQGFVVASERLWHMDLIRRKAGGRLAEWFGPLTVEYDMRAQKEDRIAISRRAATALPPAERAFCDDYAVGVNKFIAEHAGHWGLEYVLLRAEPELWSCADTLLVVLELVETLTATADAEAQQWQWRKRLSPAWQAFLYTYDHPWNEPIFVANDGREQPKGPAFPPVGEQIPMQTLVEKHATARIEDPPANGSNSWAYRNSTGAFLANDPHLANGVPGIWFAQRLRVSSKDWVVGVAAPGLPGIAIGMNPAFAWGFTNSGEDVDDYLKEELSADGTSYLERRDASGESWSPIRRKTFKIKVRGERELREVEGRFTSRGPLDERRWLNDGSYARQWLGLQEGLLRIPSMSIALARDWEGFNAAIDQMRAPAQNVLYVDRRANLGYRTSGTGVQRRVTGRIPQSALEGEWTGLEESSGRRRKLESADMQGAAPTVVATANERIWVDDFGHNWWHQDRKERIARFLSASATLQREDMSILQRDNESRYRKELLSWLARMAPAQPLTATWATWDGTTRSDPKTFALATAADEMLAEILLGRVSETFLKDLAAGGAAYDWPLRRAWVLTTLAAGDEGLAAFGLTGADLATHMVALLDEKAKTIEPHQITNRWRGQHAFVGRVPVVGRLFAVDEPEQWGASDLVDASRGDHGPSMRMVWDLRNPLESTWVFPIGQSGHAFAPSYAIFRDRWFAGQAIKVFDDGSTWEFTGL